MKRSSEGCVARFGRGIAFWNATGRVIRRVSRKWEPNLDSLFSSLDGLSTDSKNWAKAGKERHARQSPVSACVSFSGTTVRCKHPIRTIGSSNDSRDVWLSRTPSIVLALHRLTHSQTPTEFSTELGAYSRAPARSSAVISEARPSCACPCEVSFV